jgi:hypothetical protein
MYNVIFQGQKVNKKRFSTYEKARQFARKQIRKTNDWKSVSYFYPSNPPLTEFGAQIVKA